MEVGNEESEIKGMTDEKAEYPIFWERGVRDREVLNTSNKRSREHGSSLGPTLPIKPRCVE